jgi:hypothetical protein
MSEERAELEKLKAFYGGGRLTGRMSGQMPEIIRIACKAELTMGFCLSLNKKEMWGKVLAFDDVTGRITIMAGDSGDTESMWTASFLIRSVKMFKFSVGLWQAWQTRLRK